MSASVPECPVCGVPLVIGMWPFCPHGYGSTSVKADDIPGGMVIENGFPEPVKVYSWSERRRLLKEKGLEELVRHVPMPGSDRSPHTTNWGQGIDATTLENARILVSRARESSSVPDPPTPPIPMTFTVRDL